MRSPSPYPNSVPPSNSDELPTLNQPLSQPQFNIPQRPSDDDKVVFSPTSGASNYSLVDFFGPGVDEAEMQSFCVDANVEITPSPPPSDQPIKDDAPGNPFLPNDLFPAVVLNYFPAATHLSAEEQAKSDQKRQAFLLANGFSTLATHLSKPSASGAAANANHFPSHEEEKARKDRKLQEFLTTHGFSQPPMPLSQPPKQPQASTSGPSTRSPDYDIPAEDENDSQCPSGSDDSDVPNEEDHEVVTGSGKAWQRAGRIPDDTWKKLKSAFLKLDADIDQLATDTGRTRENIISLWQNTRSLKRVYLSAWNIYEMYFREHRPQERKRVGDPKATCEFPSVF